MNALTIPEWTTACPNWEALLVSKQSIIPVGALYPDAANQAMDVMENLVMSDLANKPRFGQVARQWAMDFPRAIFGAYDPESGARRIREFFMLISKKNSKSTLSAGIMLTALVLNWREGAKFMIIAPTKKVASNSFDQAVGMIRNDPHLAAILHIQGYGRLIRHRLTNATLEILAADSETVTGTIATGVLIEEVHEFGKKERAEAMFLEAKGGIASRSEGFVIYLTTHSEEPPAGVFKKLLQYARDVRDGKIIDPQFLPVLYEFPNWMLEADLHKKPENFYITNPNLGASVSENYLVSEFKKAEESGEESLRGFMAKHLNVPLGLNLRSDRWRGADYWENQATVLSLDDLLERSEVVIVGGDGGGLDDLLGMAVLGRDKVSKDWLLWAHAWCSRKVLEVRKNIASRLLDFEAAGELTIVDEDSGDQDCYEFGAICGRIYEMGLLHQVGLDPLMIGGLMDGIIDGGVPAELIFEVKQGFRLDGYIKTSERKLSAKKLWHGNSGLMNWCVGNARIEQKGNNIYITKQASGRAKIDPVIAMLNAVGLMSLNPEAMGGEYSDYSDMVMVGI